jgi:GT2 family glycosyltransferase/glycosyltransferase involved in cell wall biosynthesis
MKKNILYFSPESPNFDQSSGGNRLFEILKILQEKYQVYYFLDASISPKYIDILKEMGIFVFTTAPHYEELKRLSETTKFECAFFAWWYVGNMYLKFVKEKFPGIKTVVDSVDVHWIREERGDSTGDPEIQERKNLEKKVYMDSDVVLAVTENDKQHIADECGELDVRIVSNIHRQEKSFLSLGNDVVFIGGFSHKPNIDAAISGCRIFKKFIEEFQTTANFYIIGNAPPKEVTELHDGKRIFVTGYVEDPGQYFNKARVMLAPLTWGAGVKGKICQSATYRIPILTSDIGIEGLSFNHKEDCYVANTDQEFLDCLKDVYNRSDSELNKLTENALRKTLALTSEENARVVLENIIEQTPIAISILCHNHSELLEPCVKSIVENTEYCNYKIVITNNGSTDDTQKIIENLIRKYPSVDIRCVSNKINDFFVKPNNKVINDYLDHDIVLLNNDTQILSRCWLTQLRNAAYSAGYIACSGGMTVDKQNNISEAGAHLFSNGEGNNQGRWQPITTPQYNKRRYVGYVSGCLMYMRRDAINKIGALDELYYPMYYEDSDWQYTAHVNGLKTIYEPKCVVFHEQGTSSNGKSEEYKNCNRRKFVEKFKDKNIEQYICDSVCDKRIKLMPTNQSIAVVVTHLYGTKLLNECLESLSRQTLSPTEIIVIDDSPNDSKSVSKRFGAQHIKVDYHRNLFLSRKKGYQNTISPLLMFLNSEDRIDENYIQQCFEKMVSSPQTGIVGSDVILFDEASTELHKTNWLHSGACVRRVVLENSEAFEGNIVPTQNEDQFVWYKAVGIGTKVEKVESRYFKRKLTPPTDKRKYTLSVIIPCHNYGNFIGEAIESVLNQNLKATEIIVIDDDSTDNTLEVVSRYPEVKYHKVAHHNVLLARKEGFDLTSGEFVVFLDADDKLGPKYFSECLTMMKSDQSVGIAYSNIVYFGSQSGLVGVSTKTIDRSNFIHSAAMVRRCAITSSDAFKEPLCGKQAGDDWFIWRRIINTGWKYKKIQSSSYFYRQHEKSMTHNWETKKYKNVSAINIEPITMFVPLSGRKEYWPRMIEFIEKQNISELMIVNSGDDDFKSMVKEDLTRLKMPAISHIELPCTNNIADVDRRNNFEVEKIVCSLMPKIYNNLRRITTNYVFVVEDDVLPPIDALARLLDSMDADVAAVSGDVQSRFWPGQSLAHKYVDGVLTPLEYQSGNDTQDVDGSGFGCLLLRRSAILESAPFNDGGSRYYDVEFSKQVKFNGWRWLIDWSVNCVHGN